MLPAHAAIRCEPSGRSATQSPPDFRTLTNQYALFTKPLESIVL
jgi:hypothetical protein